LLIVSDTSPIRGLQALALIHVLKPLYEQVLVPPAVHLELTRARVSVPPVDFSLYGFIEVRAPIAVRSFPRLGPGESEAISLALELGASTLLIDEVGARRVVQSHGIRPVGVLGVLVEAKQRGLVARVAPLIEQLRERISFRVSEGVIARVLSEAGE
jgi:uncharacterized protein